MSDATTSDAPLPRAPIAPATEPAAPRRARKRDTILFATTALVVAGATAGVILSHRIEPVVEPLIAHVFGHPVSGVEPSPHSRTATASSVSDLSAIPKLSPPPVPWVVSRADSSRKTMAPAKQGGGAPAKAKDGTLSDHPSGHSADLPTSTFNALVDLKRGAIPATAQQSVAPVGPTAAKSRLGETVVVPFFGNKPIVIPALEHAATPKTDHGTVIGKASDASISTSGSTSPAVPAITAKSIAPPPEPIVATAHPAVPPPPEVNALLHPIAPPIAPPPTMIAPADRARPAVTTPVTPGINTTATAAATTPGTTTLATIAHPVQTATHLVAGPLNPKSEIPVLSLVSQLGVLVAQLRDENEALAHQVATLQATTTRRLDTFSRTLHLDQAKSALALAVQPAQAPRAAIHPHVFQSHSAVPAGTISASSYRIIASSPGVAIISRDGRSEEVSVGDTVPGVGRVLSLTEDGTSWVVETTHGVIR
ncbi:hypothetical protein [Acidiphilium sp.]|uniref:hypothetical protein n=1 Tax=Acidiphilium sp. TaxID=527 RepID=UPI003D01DEBD